MTRHVLIALTVDPTLPRLDDYRSGNTNLNNRTIWSNLDQADDQKDAGSVRDTRASVQPKTVGIGGNFVAVT